MKTKLLIFTAIAALCVATPAFAKHRVVQTRNGRAVVVNTHRHDSRSSHVFWNVGIGFPFYGGYYGGYPAILITEVAITTAVTHTDTAIIHTVTITPTTTPVIRTLTTDIPIGTTTIQS